MLYSVLTVSVLQIFTPFSALPATPPLPLPPGKHPRALRRRPQLEARILSRRLRRRRALPRPPPRRLRGHAVRLRLQRVPAVGRVLQPHSDLRHHRQEQSLKLAESLAICAFSRQIILWMCQKYS